MVDVGSGPALVLVPGIQGRWEYMKPAVDALSRVFRVLTFPLAGEPGADRPFEPALGLDNYSQQLLAALDRRGISKAVICGISFGGLPALRFAATHAERTDALVLVSTPAPPWQLRPRHRLYVRLPWLFGPLFFIESPFRLRAEVHTAIPAVAERRQFTATQLKALIRAPLSPTRMAERAFLVAEMDVAADCARIVAPTLVVTGEPALDRVVSVRGTLSYVGLIANARHATLEGTGHLGFITKPDLFAATLQQFVSQSRAGRNGSSTETHDAA